MNYNIAEQALGFDPVLPWEGQVKAWSIEPDGPVLLRLAAPDAHKVSFEISDQEYLCIKNAEGIWEMEFPFQRGYHYLQLKIDDTQVLTPLLPIGYGYSRPYNYLELGDTEDFYQIKDVPHGTVRREFFYSTVTETWESCVVYTPAVYENETDKTFPVLYLQHGHGENEVGWTTAGKVHFILDNLIAEDKVTPFVVVMCNGMVQTVGANGAPVVDFKLLENQMIEDVIPFIESKLRIGGSREIRAMAGLSMGSLQTSIIGFSHPELFSALGVFSGFVTDIIQGSVLDMVDRGPSENEHLAILEDCENFAQIFPVYFRAMGEEDPFRPFFEKDDELLAQKQIPQIRKTYQGTHDWNVWRQCVRDFAQLIFRK